MKKRRLILAIAFIIIGMISTILFEKYFVDRPFSLDRWLIYNYVIIFLGLHIIYDIKKIWGFIYKKRYLIGIVIFSYVVLMGYNGSSMFTFNTVIEPDYTTRDMVPFWGESRPIKSDEYRVGTPSLLSQYYRNKDFETINNALMGRDTLVTLYPSLPTKSLSIISNPQFLGFLFLDLEQAYAFWWYFDYFVAFFALFEMFMILTKNNKLLSLTGTIMLEFSPLVLWWSSLSFLMYGSLATVFFYHIFHSSKKWQKVLFAILLGWSGSCYVTILYPAWMIPYGYMYIVLFVYCIYLNRKNIKWTDFLHLILAILVLCILLIPVFLNSKETVNAMMSTEYPGARSSIGGFGWELYYYYFINIFYTIYDVGNPCEFSQLISFYPIPIILSCIYIIKDIKNKKSINLLLLLLTILSILLSIWNYIPIGIFAKFTMLSMSIPARTQAVVSIICIILIIILMNDYVTNNITWKRRVFSIILGLIICSFGLYICHNDFIEYITSKKLIFSFLFFFGLIYLLNINTKKGNILFSLTMILFGCFLFITTHPINKGVSVITEKPVSKEIQSIVKQEKDSLWITISSNINLQSYILANGARVLNSTNYYPNLDLWRQFDPEREYNEIYNRYAHIEIELTEENTNFELLNADFFRLNLNKNDICKLNVDYIASMTSDLDEIIENSEKIYQYSNISIYKLNCNN